MNYRPKLEWLEIVMGRIVQSPVNAHASLRGMYLVPARSFTVCGFAV